LLQSYHFDQDEHYMPGFSKFFKEMAEEEHEHAQKVRLVYRTQCNIVLSRETSVCGIYLVLCWVMLPFVLRLRYVILCFIVLICFVLSFSAT
jgi:CHASE3 domain sensor protein